MPKVEKGEKPYSECSKSKTKGCSIMSQHEVMRKARWPQDTDRQGPFNLIGMQSTGMFAKPEPELCNKLT